VAKRILSGPGAAEDLAAPPDPNRPYMMWAGTLYEHAMIQVSPAK
jgi:hypothetical protein